MNLGGWSWGRSFLQPQDPVDVAGLLSKDMKIDMPEIMTRASSWERIRKRRIQTKLRPGCWLSSLHEKTMKKRRAACFLVTRPTIANLGDPRALIFTLFVLAVAFLHPLLYSNLFAKAQKTVASLGDPCDCNQNHDYWQTMIDTMLLHLTPELPNALFAKGSASESFFGKQSCIWSSDNEDSHRLAALSDCIPGFVAMKISCVQHLVWKAYEAMTESVDPENNDDPHFVDAKASVDLALGHMAEVLRTAAFGKDCMDESVWPVSMNDIYTNYIRFYRTHSYYRVTENMLKALVWVSETCATSADCVGGNVAGRRCKHGRCVAPEDPGLLAGKDSDVQYFCAQPGGYLDGAGRCWHMGNEGESCNEVCEYAGSRPDPAYFPDKHRHMTTPILRAKSESVVYTGSVLFFFVVLGSAGASLFVLGFFC